MTVCYRHPDRATALRCIRCGRYICGDCMRGAAVGQHCVDCAQEGAAQRRTRPLVRSASGAPVVSYGLIALNVLAFIAQMSSGRLDSELVLWSPAVADGQIYRLLTSAFLHYGPMHLLLNMWALYVVGPSLEGLLGRARFIALYLLSALGGSVAVYLLAPLDTATAGASGAIFGLFGATLVVGRRLRMDVGWVVAVIGINLVFTFTIPRISWQGHVGGLIAGLLVACAYVYPAPARRNRIQALASIALLVLFVALIWWRTAELVS
ncbi:rhomboid family intramembrane serine protease [Mycolicibacter terrae]|uniref:Rhomboid family intramembrane serine protease n=1 Tax=Mycolicibacter terrae TaxID=1788 RepID=A0AAD1I031_9MYCO|nr:rhomboid family intramembrane serine protease [Mycolicibacter terrae]ORW95181.1 rhomboid family intramembrane serine protease [Mycolicibacter terrae]BBX24752.1 rhomboid family intramembrane serine protease [Mycolicibacter terrae]SNV95443.1 serine protease [Mycolicibacter terrae]